MDYCKKRWQYRTVKYRKAFAVFVFQEAALFFFAIAPPKKLIYLIYGRENCLSIAYVLEGISSQLFTLTSVYKVF